MVEDRALQERTLQGAEGGLHPGEQHVEGPDLRVGQILAIGLEEVAPSRCTALAFLSISSCHVTARVVGS